MKEDLELRAALKAALEPPGDQSAFVTRVMAQYERTLDRATIPTLDVLASCCGGCRASRRIPGRAHRVDASARLDRCRDGTARRTWPRGFGDSARSTGRQRRFFVARRTTLKKKRSHVE